MKAYNVEITETLQRTISIEAYSKMDALRIAKQLYDGENIVLDYSDFVDKKVALAKD
ncbi:MAG: DpnD/PcfM family protein [Victivallales bacterium]|jgi:hypothetical protein|nr:DpnD/PcfM family protein [Victivallales bacterium]